MNQLLEVIKNKGIPLNIGHAAQYLGQNGIGPQSESFYVEGIYELTNTIPTEKNADILRITYSYLVCAIIGLSENTDKVDGQVATLLEMSEARANKMFVDSPWHFAKSEGEENFNDDGQVKAKKGSKKVLAQKVYNDQIKGKNLSRKDAIALLVEAGVSTPAGSSTYYARLKKNEL